MYNCLQRLTERLVNPRTARYHHSCTSLFTTSSHVNNSLDQFCTVDIVAEMTEKPKREIPGWITDTAKHLHSCPCLSRCHKYHSDICVQVFLYLLSQHFNPPVVFQSPLTRIILFRYNKTSIITQCCSWSFYRLHLLWKWHVLNLYLVFLPCRPYLSELISLVFWGKSRIWIFF